jgi:hypothetical protein
MKTSVLMILALIFFFPVTTIAQNEGVKKAQSQSSSESKSMYSRSTKESAMLKEQAASGERGSPLGLSSENASCYLEPGWVPGKVVLYDNSESDSMQLRYDIYHQQLQFVRDTDTLAFAKPEEINYFILGEKVFIYREYQSDNIIDKCFFEVMTQGEGQLLMRRTVKYHVTPESKPNLEEDLYIRECDYFISLHGAAARTILLNRTSVLNALNDKKDQVDLYMKDNHLKMNTCQNLIEVVDYYNSLK